MTKAPDGFDLATTLALLFRRRRFRPSRRTIRMTTLLRRLDTLLAQIPHELLALLARLSVGTIFLRSGLLEARRLGQWHDSRAVPGGISPAAPLARAGILSGDGSRTFLPILLFLGLFTRPAALALLGMTLVIEVFVYPNAFDTHGVWAVALLYLAKFFFFFFFFFRAGQPCPRSADLPGGAS